LEALSQAQHQVKKFSLQGHALVRGVVGSGKSLVLVDRVKALVAAGMTDILVLSYNRFMRGWLNAQFAERFPTVECKTFHQWAFHNLKYTYRQDNSPSARQQLISLAQQSGLRYQAILIDEAQDFCDEWLMALLQVLHPETQSLFFVYDNTQSVYGQIHRRKLDWSWKQLGIEVVGRSQILDVNYRNTPEILEAAWKFILPALSQAEMKVVQRSQATRSIDSIIEPRKKLSRSSGLRPSLYGLRTDQIAEEVAQQVQLALQGHPEASVGILLHPSQSALKPSLSQALRRLQVAHHAPKDSQERNSATIKRPCVIVDSWNALKGVEFDAVILVGIDHLNEYPGNPDMAFQERAGLYTAMTRGRDHLVLIYQERTPTVCALEAAIAAPDQLASEP
jgi:superfamily I DNA/RNA helicase